MALGDLPVEIFHKILVHSVISRGVQRALRLKLVCKLFNIYLQAALFESRLLDEFMVEPRVGSRFIFNEMWYIRNNYGSEKLWQSYLLYRVRNERDPEKGRFVEIRRVAEEVCLKTDAEYESTLNALCWLAVERGSHAPGYQEGWGLNLEGRGRYPGLNLLSAAAYLNHLDLAKELLADGKCPSLDGSLFPSPMQLAAWAGNSDMLRLFQESLPDFEETTPPGTLKVAIKWKAKIGPGAIKGAAMRGDMDMLRLAIYPPSRSSHESTDFCGQKFGQVDKTTRPGRNLEEALYYAKDSKVFEYIEAFFIKEEAPVRIDLYSHLLAHHAALGNLSVVRYLLDSGALVDGGTARTNENALTTACRNCHEEVVDLLLARGANPSYQRLQWLTCPIYAASSAGSLAIVKKLLDRGATFERVHWEPVGVALRLEHTAMVKLILGLAGWGKEELRRTARWQSEKGMESMASLVLSMIPSSTREGH